MAKIGLPKGAGKRLNVRVKSVKRQGILKRILSDNPVFCLVYFPQVERLLELHFKYLDRVRAVDDQIEREKLVRAISCRSNTGIVLAQRIWSH